ncbi:MAG: ABC transporter permease [Candidatus Omnitrophica bacterium]|nr:ABC transporter permease [Candidatus Omnitrophota bacterium]
MKTTVLIATNLMKEIFRKKDIYVFVVLLVILLIYLINMNFFDIGGLSRYLKEIGLGMVYLFSLFITVPFSAKLVGEEIQNKTIYPLLAKPVTRFQFIAGKFLGALLVAGASFSLFYFIFYLVDISKGTPVGFILYLETYAFAILMLALLSALTIFLSIHMTFSTTVTLAYLIYFIMSWFGASFRDYFYNFSIPGYIAYYLLPHFEFFDLRDRVVHSWPALPAWVVGCAAAYALIYISVLLYFSAFAFKKKWF